LAARKDNEGRAVDRRRTRSLRDQRGMHPEHAESIQRVLAIPAKRHQHKLVCFLTREEIDALLSAPDNRTWFGRRDHTLLTLAVQTGLRVSELTRLVRHDIQLGAGAHVRCHGKGRKDRATPLSAHTVTALTTWLHEYNCGPTDPVFPTRRGRPLSTDAVAWLLTKHAATAARHCPSLNDKHLTPHILRHTAAMQLLHSGVDISVIARGTPGFTGADLANLVNEAALNAARYNKKLVAMGDFELAKDKVLMGAERKSMVISNEEKRVTAYHEAGHTLVGLKVPNADPVHKVTIIPRGMALGVTQQLPEGDRHNYSQEYLLGQIAILMGGRIAEETFLGSITTGASNDIERATELARAMVCEYGMSEMGPLTFGKKEEQIFLGREIAQHRDFSEDTAIKIDDQVKKIVTAQYQRAKGIIEENHDTMVRLAECLLERESLDGVEIRRIVAGLPLDDQPSVDSGSDQDRPQLKEPTAKPLKPILPPITGGNPAPA